MGLFSYRLLPASFRGVPFAVVDTATQLGRRLVVHEYPGRDVPWTEDMGRGARRIRFRGFIVANDMMTGAGSIEVQRALLTAAAESAGAGTLTHPTLGILNVCCEGLSISEGLDGGTVSSVEFSFVEAGAQGLPNLFISSFGLSGALLSAVALAVDAVRIVSLGGRAKGGSGTLAVTTAAWCDRISDLAGDATALTRLVASLPGNYGRYSRGAASAASDATTITDLVVAAATQRATVAIAITAVKLVVNGLGADTDEDAYAAAVAALVAALGAACADPADAVRLLTQALLFVPGTAGAGTPVGLAATALFQRLAAIEIARAAAAYQPASYEDAFAMLVRVADILDAAILSAADAGLDDLFATLRSLRVAVIDDLRARGASLTHVRTFSFGRALPALMLAQRLYRDPSRADELVAATAPRHPLFMPAQFQALSA